MIAIIHEAHSGPSEVGAVTSSSGLSEHSMGPDVTRSIVGHLANHSIDSVVIKGPIATTYDRLNKAARDARAKNHVPVVVSCHFNAMPPGKSASGHTCVINSGCSLSGNLAKVILLGLSKALNWSPVLPLILSPDHKRKPNEWPNKLIFPRLVDRPNCLVEAGFNTDERFCEWIESPEGRHEYGKIVAESILAWGITNRLLGVGNEQS